ncbi:MAG TPA: hypothetical protein VGG08_04570 [Solirubrobacteraceae bacterium]
MANVRVINWLASFSAGLRLPTGAGAGKIAVSDASGNISWGEGPTWENITELNAGLSALSVLTWSTLQAGALAGIGYLSGALEVKSEVAVKAKLFLLPAIARPEKQQGILLSNFGNAANYSALIKTNGEVILEQTPIKLAGSPVVLNNHYRLKG